MGKLSKVETFLGRIGKLFREVREAYLGWVGKVFGMRGKLFREVRKAF